MRPKLLIPGLAVVAIGVAACGSSSKSSTGSGGSAGPSKSKTGVPGRTYHVKLSGQAETPPGAPKGTGQAVIALHGSSLRVCWRFSHLRGFSAATVSHVHSGPKGASGPVVVPLSTGTKLHHKGCVHASAGVIRAIEKNPAGYYVNIHSKKYPGGAVRAQL